MDILKVGHHGSKTSTGEDFIERIEPTYSLISVGRKNRYNHPHVETILTLQKYHSKIYQTSIHGMIQMTLEKKIRVKTCIWGTLRNSVYI